MKIYPYVSDFIAAVEVQKLQPRTVHRYRTHSIVRQSVAISKIQ